MKGEKTDDENYVEKKAVHYVEIRLPEDGNSEQRTWFNIVENDQVESN